MGWQPLRSSRDNRRSPRQQHREEAQRHTRAEGLAIVPSFAPDLVPDVATYALEPFQAVADLDVVYVPDSDIAAAIRTYWTDTHNLIETAGAAPIASGGNTALSLFRARVG